MRSRASRDQGVVAYAARAARDVDLVLARQRHHLTAALNGDLSGLRNVLKDNVSTAASLIVIGQRKLRYALVEIDDHRCEGVVSKGVPAHGQASARLDAQPDT